MRALWHLLKGVSAPFRRELKRFWKERKHVRSGKSGEQKSPLMTSLGRTSLEVGPLLFLMVSSQEVGPETGLLPSGDSLYDNMYIIKIPKNNKKINKSHKNPPQKNFCTICILGIFL